MKQDFVRSVVSLARETLAADPTTLSRFETQLRLRHAGETVWVNPREPVTLEKINERLTARQNVRAVAADLGVSRETIYRRLRQAAPATAE